MKFADLQKGTAARKTVSLALASGAVSVDVRVLTPAEEIDAYAKAVDYAKAKGVVDPREGEPVFDWAHAAFLVLAAAVDTDSPPSKPEPFFDGIDQVLGNEIRNDDIAFLKEAWSNWQDECGGRVSSMSLDETWGAIVTMARLESYDAAFFFANMRPAMQFSFARFMAVQLVNSQSVSSSPSASTLSS